MLLKYLEYKYFRLIFLFLFFSFITLALEVIWILMHTEIRKLVEWTQENHKPIFSITHWMSRNFSEDNCELQGEVKSKRWLIVQTDLTAAFIHSHLSLLSCLFHKISLFKWQGCIHRFEQPLRGNGKSAWVALPRLIYNSKTWLVMAVIYCMKIFALLVLVKRDVWWWP